MNYYKTKKIATHKIEKMIIQSDGKPIPINTINLTMLRAYGYSPSTVRKMLKIYESVGWVRIEGDELKPMLPKREKNKLLKEYEKEE